MINYGFVKVATASPRLKVANPKYNTEEMIKLVKEADSKGTALIVFPELSITGYTCADLFFQNQLLNSAIESLDYFIKQTSSCPVVSIVGLPLLINDKLYNCAAAIKQGEILGVIPKMYIPNYKEFYEKRWFTSGIEISKKEKEIKLLGKKVPFGNLIFKNDKFSFGIEVCEDLWAPVAPSTLLALNGAVIIANLSASNELVSKSDYRKQLISMQSAKTMAAYLYASAGTGESTTDVVFGGDCCIYENGSKLVENERFSRESNVVYADVDLDKLKFERNQNKTFADCSDIVRAFEYQIVEYGFRLEIDHFNDINKNGFDRFYLQNPFVPNNKETINERCREIFNIQVAGLVKRLEHTDIKKAVIGVSGGLDSTLALLVTKEAFDVLNIPPQNILAVTMPGFGTTDRTYDNAMNLMEALGVTIKEVNIVEASIQHFKDIGHDPKVHDITYENTQARERTQILMNLANKVGGLVIGTGDLSEMALGWCTYNGDHMSMYAVNNSVPKTLVQFMIKWIIEYNPMETESKEALKKVLWDILDTPISPELLPPDELGKIQQKTESVVGPYILHDFFLFHTIRYGATPHKLLFISEIAFKDIYTIEEIKKWLKIFYKRFFTQQFKRSCVPDGPKVGSVSLSPRGDWRMPSDACRDIWIDAIDNYFGHR